jgi:carboxylesterase
MSKQPYQIIPTAEPFFFPGGTTGCLLIHGFTGTPKEMRLLGDYLHRQGHTVLGVRLAGHATQIEDMIRSRYQDWLGSIEDGWHLLQNQTDQIFLIGFSLGGVLSFVASSYLPVAGVVALATPYELPHKIAKALGPLLIPISKILPIIQQKEGEWFNPEMAEGHVNYTGRPLRPVYELHQVIQRMQAILPDINIPVLTIQSRDDLSVLPENAEELFKHIGGQDKTQIWVDKTNHALVLDGDTSKVFQPSGEFIQRVSNAG